jgi:hypothetical protein
VRITPHTTIFFDVSVVVAGPHSAQGGSALPLEACRLRSFLAQTTFLVVLEAYHALQRSFPSTSVVRFYTHLVEIEWDICRFSPDTGPPVLRLRN